LITEKPHPLRLFAWRVGKRFAFSFNLLDVDQANPGKAARLGSL
jgi:hypothetical protein